jgi:hypothetical protein
MQLDSGLKIIDQTSVVFVFFWGKVILFRTDDFA